MWSKRRRRSRARPVRTGSGFTGFSEAGDGHPYAGLRAVLATKHDKLPLLASPLRKAVGLEVFAAEVDTDLLGTFTPERKRRHSPLEAAIAKARMGMAATGEAIGIASEGSIGPDPDLPLLMSDREVVVLVDDLHGIVIQAWAQSFHVVAESGAFRPGDDMDDFLARAGFPDHKLIVMPNRTGRRLRVVKGVGEPDVLRAAIAEFSGLSRDSLARVESDLRANANPTRRAVIAEAAEALARRVATRCPTCMAPGWGEGQRWVVHRCVRCGALEPRAEATWCCVACQATEMQKSPEPPNPLCHACSQAELTA